jgi:hypothetical protein
LSQNEIEKKTSGYLYLTYITRKSFPWNSLVRFHCPVIETPVLHIHKAGGVQYVPSPAVLADYIALDHCGFDSTTMLFEYRRNSHRELTVLEINLTWQTSVALTLPSLSVFERPLLSEIQQIYAMQ